MILVYHIEEKIKAEASLCFNLLFKMTWMTENLVDHIILIYVKLFMFFVSDIR